MKLYSRLEQSRFAHRNLHKLLNRCYLLEHILNTIDSAVELRRFTAFVVQINRGASAYENAAFAFADIYILVIYAHCDPLFRSWDNLN